MRASTLKYTQLIHRQARVALGMAVLLAVAAAVAIHLGPIKITFPEIWRGADSSAWQVLIGIRLPRILAAVLAGAGLSVCGLAMQHVLRNPLASPFTLGISGAAAFGAAFCIVMVSGQPSFFNAETAPGRVFTSFLTGVSAFLSSMIALAVILLVIRRRGSRPSILVLAGMMTSSLFGALTSALQYFADDRQLAEIVFWTFGDPGRAGYSLLAIQSIVILPVLFWMIRHRWDFALLQSGDDAARAGGLDPSRFRLQVLTLTSMVTAILVAGYGIISFVGLVAPHLSKNFIKGQSLSLAGSALFGAIFLLVSDTIARAMWQPIILPVGIITAFFGAPFFIAMLIKDRGL